MGSGESAICSKGEGERERDGAAAALRGREGEIEREREAGRKFKGRRRSYNSAQWREREGMGSSKGERGVKKYLRGTFSAS